LKQFPYIFSLCFFLSFSLSFLLCLFPFTSEHFATFLHSLFLLPKQIVKATDPLVLAVRKLFPISYRATTFSFSALCFCFKDQGIATFLKLGTYLPCSGTHLTTEIRTLTEWRCCHTVRFAMPGFLLHDL